LGMNYSLRILGEIRQRQLLAGFASHTPLRRRPLATTLLY
jgi:hypothetical protein